MKRFIILSLSLFCMVAPAFGARRPSAPPPAYPGCSIVTGTAAVTFTRDGGETLAPTASPLRGIGYTYGLVTLDTPNTLLAWHRDALLLSTDAGCSWRTVTNVVDPELFPPTLVAAPGGRAYAYSESRVFLFRYDERGAVTLKSPGALVGLGVDKNDANRLRAGDVEGRLWQSTDAGETWTELGRVPVDAPLVYRFAFDANDLDHIVAGAVTSGAWVTRDGGRTWTRATGVASRSANVFNLVVSPVDGNVVWAMGIDMAESDANVPSHGRHIYRSTDGGFTYRPVVDENAAVKLVNGPTMAAHPTDPNVVYFVFGSAFQGYGTDLFRYDAFTNRLTTTHSTHHGINAIAFSKTQPGLMYLGLEREERGTP